LADIVRCPLALVVGTLGRPLAWFLDTARIHTPNGTSIGSSVFVGRAIVTNRQTDRPPSIGNYSRHLMISMAMRSNESQIPLHGPDPTRSDRTRLLQDMSVPATRVSDKVWSVPNSTTRTHGLRLRPDQTRPTDKVRIHVEIERTSLRCRRTCRRPKRSVGRVWSVLCIVEFSNDTTGPDQRQSLVGPV